MIHDWFQTNCRPESRIDSNRIPEHHRLVSIGQEGEIDPRRSRPPRVDKILVKSLRVQEHLDRPDTLPSQGSVGTDLAAHSLLHDGLPDLDVFDGQVQDTVPTLVLGQRVEPELVQDILLDQLQLDGHDALEVVIVKIPDLSVMSLVVLQMERVVLWGVRSNVDGVEERLAGNKWEEMELISLIRR